jgi:hypothetical protein
MTPDEFAADKARRIAGEIVKSADEVSALVASRPLDAPMLVELIGIAAHHDATVQGIMMEAPPPAPGTIVREVRRVSVGRAADLGGDSKQEGER